VSADVTAEHLTRVVRVIAALDIDDGVAFDHDTITVQEIREQADYPGLACTRRRVDRTMAHSSELP
jgi:hypothetical protein